MEAGACPVLPGARGSGRQGGRAQRWDTARAPSTQTPWHPACGPEEKRGRAGTVLTKGLCAVVLGPGGRPGGVAWMGMGGWAVC